MVGNFERWLAAFLPNFDPPPANVEIKFAVIPANQPTVAPRAITDREAFLVYDDIRSTMRWGLVLQGTDYTALAIQWFDDLWAMIPNENLVYAHTGWNQKALDFVRSQLEANAAASERELN